MTLGARFRKVSDTVGGVSRLARLLQIRSSGLYSYFRNESKPGAEILSRVYHIGISVDWLLTGRGSMYAGNFRGQLWRSLASTPNQPSNEAIEMRIHQFVESTYGSLDKFALIFRIPSNTAGSFTQELDSTTLSTLKKLGASGCNLNWLLNGTDFGMQRSDLETLLAMMLRQEGGDFEITFRMEDGCLEMLNIAACSTGSARETMRGSAEPSA